MKALHILSTGDYSGAENVVITIISHYTKDSGVYLSPRGRIGDILSKNAIEWHPVEKLTAKSIKKAIKEVKPDVIHAHDYTASLLSCLTFTKIPIIAHIHNNVPWMMKPSIKSFVFRPFVRKIKRFLAVSDSVFLESWYGKEMKKKGLVIGNPISKNAILSKKKQDIHYDLVFVGRLAEQKNPLEFIEIVDLLIRSGVSVKAVILGKGELEQECRDSVAGRGLGDAIDLKGFVDNPYDYMNQDSILVMTSKWEGFGLVAAEALTFGMPVVCTEVGGLSGIVDSSCGLCDNSLSARIKEIKRLLEDKGYFVEKHKAALSKANAIDNIDEYMKTLRNVYLDCTGVDNYD